MSTGGEPAKTKLLLSPSWEEQRFERPRYEALAEDLRGLGFEVWLEDPPDHSADELNPVDVAMWVVSGSVGGLREL